MQILQFVGCSFQVADLVARAIHSPPSEDQQKVPYFTPLNCCNVIATRRITRHIVLAGYTRNAFATARGNSSVTLQRQDKQMTLQRRSELARRKYSRRSSRRRLLR